MGAPKRAPSFSQRPGFPCGLRVLLVDSDAAARARTEEQLRDCNYEVTACGSCAEAIVQLSVNPPAFDVLLADKSAIGFSAAAAAAPAAPAGARSGLLDSCKGLPCILMASDPSPDDIMRGISLGAVDFLAKPLSPLQLRNIWQHTVRKMMGDMRIHCGGSNNPAAPPPAKAARAAAAAGEGLGRSASSCLPDAAGRQQTEQQQLQPQHQRAPPAPAAAAAPVPRPGLPPRSPAPRSPVLRARRPQPRPALHACISSTNLAAPGPAPAAVAEEDCECDFDFDAAEAAMGSPVTLGPSSPACGDGASPAAAAATATQTATATATATATHASLPPAPAPSCGLPVAGVLAQLAPGMVWGMPMHVVRAPGIVPPRQGAAPAPAPQIATPPAPWGPFMGCAMPPMPSHGFMMPPPFGMMPPPLSAPSMCGVLPPFAAPLQCARRSQQQQPQRQAAPTGAAAAQALDASLLSLLGSAEDDGGDLASDLDLDDVLQDLGGGAGRPDHAPLAAGKPAGRCMTKAEAAAAAAAADTAGGGCGDGWLDEDLLGSCGGAGAGASSPGSMGSSHDALAPGGAGPAGCGGALGAFEDGWGPACGGGLPKSGSIADLLAAA